MAWFQLDAESIAARTKHNSSTRLPTLAGSLLHGAIGFTAVSVAGFASWAFFGRWLYQQVGEAGLYATCAVVFIGLSGIFLHRLILGSGSLSRFYKLFTPAFILYAAAWIACYVGFRGNLGVITGLLGGTALMALIFTVAFSAGREALKVIAALFALNTLGYYVGEWVETKLIVHHTLAAMLLWGVCYGLGFGAGLGLAFHLCQAKARQLIASRVSPAT